MKTSFVHRLEMERGKPIEDILREYSERRLLPEQVAHEIGCSLSGLHRFSRPFGGRFVRRFEVVQNEAE